VSHALEQAGRDVQKQCRGADVNRMTASRDQGRMAFNADFDWQRDFRAVRIRLASLLLAGLSFAAVGASVAVSYGQSPTLLARSRHGGDAAAPSAAKNEKNKPAAKKDATPPPVQPDKLTRPEFTAAEEAVAEVPGFAGVRFWADSAADFERALPKPAGPWLILSTGGAEGAYGAGFLNGWSAAGTRPQFAAITGVSTGALMATYVFAGPQYDDELHRGYTEITASDIFEIGATPESMQWNFRCADRAGWQLDVAIDGRGLSLHRLPYLKTNCSGTFEVCNNSLASAQVTIQRPNRSAELLQTSTGAVLEIVR